MSEATTKSGGIGFIGLLVITLVVLKALGHITWSWFWVFSPLLVIPSIVLIILAVGSIAWIVAWLVDR